VLIEKRRFRHRVKTVLRRYGLEIDDAAVGLIDRFYELGRNPDGSGLELLLEHLGAALTDELGGVARVHVGTVANDAQLRAAIITVGRFALGAPDEQVSPAAKALIQDACPFC